MDRRDKLTRKSMVIPIYNNNPRAPMRDNVSRAKTTYSSRNAGGGEQAEEPKVSLISALKTECDSRS